MHLNSTLSKKILAWYDNSKRDLPWRVSKKSPKKLYYRLLSEVMLQQTQVKTVLPYFKKFSKKLVLSAPNHKKSMWQFPKKYFASAAKKKSNIFLNRLKWKDNRKLLVDTNIGPGQEFIFDAQEVPDISLWAKSLTEE